MIYFFTEKTEDLAVVMEISSPRHGNTFSIRVNRADYERMPQLRDEMKRELTYRMEYHELSAMSPWQVKKWCEENIFQKTTFLCPKCHGFGPVQMRIEIERRSRIFFLFVTEHDEEVNIYRCLKCGNDYKHDSLDAERKMVELDNEHAYISKMVALKKMTPDEASKAIRSLHGMNQ